MDFLVVGQEGVKIMQMMVYTLEVVSGGRSAHWV